MGFKNLSNQVTYTDNGGSFDNQLVDTVEVENSLTTLANNALTNATAANTAKEAAEAAKIAAETAKTNAETAETNAETAETNAETAETNAETAETNAAASATASANSATAAATSASTATTKASEAVTSASNASNSASTATTKATEASNSATAAASSASSAQASKDAALAALDNFDDRYLGVKSSDPSVDNDGDALVSGSLYFNSTSDTMKVYEGSSWVAAYASLTGVMLSADNLSDLTNVGTARTNLGLGTAATTDATAYATASHVHTFASLTSKPTTIAGYGITDSFFDGSYSSLSGKPTLGTAAATALSDYATAAQGTKADTAHAWGNHASVGYATGAQGTKADTAHGWGNHASAGYATGAQGTKADTAHGWGNHATAGYGTTDEALALSIALG